MTILDDDRSAFGRPPRVIVVGSLNLDTTVAVPRRPAAGETISATSRSRNLGGKGANQAIAASRAGADVTMVGAVGSDAEATSILAALRDDDLASDHVTTHPGESGAAFVVVSADGENTIVVSAGANALLDQAAIDAALAGCGPGDHVLLQNEIPPESTAHAARIGRARGARVVWNAAPVPTDRRGIPDGVDLLVVNETELVGLASLLGTPPSPVNAALAGVADALAAEVVCTLGPRGAVAILAGEHHAIAASAVRAVDTTAAGDTFTGYLVACADLDPADRLRVAVAAGAAAVTRSGASTSIPHLSEIAALTGADHPTTAERTMS